MTEPTANNPCYRFGRFELQPGERRLLVDGAPMAVGPRAFDLLVVLVERAGRLVSKDELFERVWPKLVVEESNLQVQISSLRKILGHDTIATVAGHGYRFTVALEHSDVGVRDVPAASPYVASELVTFLFTDVEGSARLWEEEPERMRLAMVRHDAIVRGAVERHRGVVVKLTGDGVHAAFDEPLDAVAATLQLQQELSDPAATNGIALRVRCGLHAGADERRDNDFYGPAVNRAARITHAAHGGQMLLSQEVATQVHGRLPPDVTLRDLGAVRLRGLATSEHVYQIVHPPLRSDFPALRDLETTPNNLAQPLTSFVGREHELEQVKKLLENIRLVTLLGVGGLGKTRLSQQVAAAVLDDYPDGVWFVDLAPQTDKRLLPQTVASVLGVKEEPGRSVDEALIEYVKDRQLLLMLDNCEHMVDECALLVKKLLQAGKQNRVLATSRQPLHVAGETTYPVPALATPQADYAQPLDALLRCASVRLFVDRARAAQPAFQITEQNAAAVTDICRRLDGIPLAIELAAARMRVLSADKIAERLSDRFRLLKSDDHTVLPRQQTLRALIDWSYESLTDAERTLFRRLAVFAGGWTLEASETVGAGGDIDASDVLDLLACLVEKSLVILEPDGERYRFLDTVQHYAAEHLSESEEEEQARKRHLAFYLTLAEEARPQLFGPEQAIWLARLDAERQNLLAAHVWCDRAPGEAESGLRLVSAVRPYWQNRGLLLLGHRVTVEALMRPGANERTHARCRALFDAGQLGCFMGRYAEAQSYLEESLAIAREIGNKERIAMALQPLALAFLGQGDAAAARRRLDEALILARELGNRREIAAALNALAQLDRMQEKLESAEALYEEVVTLARELEDRGSVAIGLLNLAMVSIGCAAGERAQGMLLEVLAICEETGSKEVGQSLLDVCAGLAALREEWERAARFYGAAAAQTERTGLRRDPTDEAFIAPLISKAGVALGEASYPAKESDGRALSYQEAMAEARAWLAHR